MRPFLALGLCLSAASAPAGTFTPEERAAIGAELRAYLLHHPEVIEEALTGAEARRYADAVANDLALIAAEAQALFHDPADWTGGNPAGDVTLVTFVDYASAASGRALAAAHQVSAADGRLRLVVKEAPAPGDADADRAARFARAVLALAGPDPYLRAQEALLAAPDHAPDTLDTIARELGLDPAALSARMTAPELGATLAANLALMARLDLGAAPAQVLDRTLVRGDLPAAALAPIVEAMRRKK